MKNKDFKFRSGKYAGKTYEWVMDKNPQYISWIKENRPEMLKEPKIVKSKPRIEVIDDSFKLTPNMNFDNEPPDAGCISYMKLQPAKYHEQLNKFRVQVL